MSDYYILDKDGNPKNVKDVLDWARWIENRANTRVAQDEDVNGYRVSTIFLGVNHAWAGKKPLLYETMAFRIDNESDVYQDRYFTKEEALQGHAKAVEMAKIGNFEEAE